jgi:hypothetical protein
MIAIFDEDGGGDVDFQEFVSGLSAFSSKGNKEEKLRFAFRVYDIDRDGYISNGELFIVLKMMVGSNLKDQQLQQVRTLQVGSYTAEASNKHLDCRQDHYGGRFGPRRQDQLRGVHQDGREHRRFYEHDPRPVLSAFCITNATASPGTRVFLGEAFMVLRAHSGTGSTVFDIPQFRPDIGQLWSTKMGADVNHITIHH